MQNIYGNSMDRTKQGHTQSYDFNDFNDDNDDYENANPVGSAPVIPSRENRRMKHAGKTDLPLKRMDLPVKEPPSVWNPIKGIASQEAPNLQLPHIGLDFSSGAVNAAFSDVTDVKSSSSYIVNEAFQHLEGLPNGEEQKKSRCSPLLVLVVVLVIISFSILAALNGFMFLEYSTISGELTGLKHNVSDFQKNDKKEQDNLKAEVKDLNKVMVKSDDSIQVEIKHINKTLETICTSCPDGWNMIGTACYYLSGDTLTWDVARDECYKFSSVLVILKDNKEMDSLKHFFKVNRRYWIGLRRDPKEIHKWKWLDGSDLSYTNWGVNEPNYYTRYEHCGETMSGPWNDRSCEDSLFYICKRMRNC
ncbi:uncharacterized protein LOC142151368 isoform X2 [Mixophyes fleayi]